MNITITAKKDINITAASLMQAPDALRDVENYYNEIDRPHTTISLLTSSAKSPTGKLLMCASNTFLFDKPHGSEPKVIHEMWDNNMHLMKFSKTIKAGTSYNYSIAGSSITSAQHEDPLNEAERMTIFAKLEGKERLMNFIIKPGIVYGQVILLLMEIHRRSRMYTACYIIYILLREKAQAILYRQWV